MIGRVVSLLLFVANAAGSGCVMHCYPNSDACTRCTAATCNVTAGPIVFNIAFSRVALCAPGYFPTTYPMCWNSSTVTARPVQYTCTRNIVDIVDSRVLQYAARQRGWAYGISPVLSACQHSCADVKLQRDRQDHALNAQCGDCVPSGSIVVGSSEVVNIRIVSASDIKSTAVMSASSFPGVNESLLSRSRVAESAAVEPAFIARRVYVCKDTSRRGVTSCLRELDARGLLDTTIGCFDGTQAVPCPDGGGSLLALEWAARAVGGFAVLLLMLSLHWWLIPVVQLIPAMLTWCNEQSSMLRALYEGADIILLKWDFTSSCPVGLHFTACELINVLISAAILLLAAWIVALITHVISWVVAGKTSGDNDNSNGLRGRVASRTFRLTFGGSLVLWWCTTMVPIAHFCSAVVFSSQHASYRSGAWWIFGAMGIVMLVVVIGNATAACVVGIAAASRVGKEVNGQPSDDSKAAPVVAQTPYGEVVSAVGGYAPLYRAYVGHVHGPASLVSATSALWNSGWWNWFPTGEPLSWSVHEGLYDGDGYLVRQFGPVFNSFNPSNVIFGTFVYGLSIAGAIISGIECLYNSERISCCEVRAALCLGFVVIIAGAFILRRPLLGDNILPAIVLLLICVAWIVYLVIISADTADQVSPQVAIITLHFIVYSAVFILGLLHVIVRFAHVLVADGSVPAVSTVAVDIGHRRAVASMVGAEAGANYIAATQQQGGLVSVPTFFGSGTYTGAGDIPAPAASQPGTTTRQAQVPPAFYPAPQGVQMGGGASPTKPVYGMAEGDEWPVESSYTILSQ